MLILPAIDIKNGQCVRLHKGDFATAHQVAVNAAETAESFIRSGAVMIHVVDLDGALSGQGKNKEIIRQIIARAGQRAAVELGGGLRTMADLEKADKMGIRRMVIGSAAVSDPNFVFEAVEKYGERIAIGIDALGGRVRVSGWTQDSGLDYIEFAKKMEGLGVKDLIFTDIDTDGMLAGPALARLSALKNAVSCLIVASGGITTIDDVKKLKGAGMDAAIIGKAVYAGTINLIDAIKEAGAQCLPNELFPV